MNATAFQVSSLPTRQAVSAIYSTPDGQKMLFVPTVSMLNLHEASEPKAILDRLGLRPDLWRSWWRAYETKFPWLFEPTNGRRPWLYSYRSPVPESARDKFTPSEEMERFRQEATANALSGYLRKAEGKKVSAPTICRWLEKFKDYTWYEGWQLRGEDPPANVVIATAKQIEYFSRLWDYPTHYRKAREQLEEDEIRQRKANAKKIYIKMFVCWLGPNQQIPSLQWLRWAYGDPSSASVYVVGERLQALRKESRFKNICKAAKVAEASITKWKAQYPKIFEAICQAVAKRKNLAGPGAWDDLPTYANRANPKLELEKFARARTLKGRCDEAGITYPSGYESYLKNADRIGAKEDLQEYLEPKESKPGPGPYGLVTGKLFVPSPLLRAFREEALKVRTTETYGRLADLPCFDQWFQDWALPVSINREARISLPENASPADESNGNANGRTGPMVVETLVAHKFITPIRRRRRQTARKKQASDSTPTKRMDRSDIPAPGVPKQKPEWMQHDSKPGPESAKQVHSGKRHPSRGRRRRRASGREPSPITPKQVEAMHLVGEHKGNMAAAARAAGISRASMIRRYNKAAAKLGKKAIKHFTQRLPTDCRGQVTVPQQ